MTILRHRSSSSLLFTLTAGLNNSQASVFIISTQCVGENSKSNIGTSDIIELNKQSVACSCSCLFHHHMHRSCAAFGFFSSLFLTAIFLNTAAALVTGLVIRTDLIFTKIDSQHQLFSQCPISPSLIPVVAVNGAIKVAKLLGEPTCTALIIYL